MELFKLFGSIAVESVNAEKNIQDIIEKAKKLKSELSDFTIAIDNTNAMKQIQAVIDKLAVLKNPVSIGTISANNTTALNALNTLISKTDELEDQIKIGNISIDDATVSGRLDALLGKINELDDPINLGSVSIDTSSVLANIQKVIDNIEQIQSMVRLMNNVNSGGSYGAYRFYQGMQGNYRLFGNAATNYTRYASSSGNVVWDLDSGGFVNTTAANAGGNNVTPIEDEATPEQIEKRNANSVFLGNMKTQFANYLGNAAVDFTKSGWNHLMSMDAYGKMLETYMHTDEETALAMRDQLQKVAEDTPLSMENVMEQAVMLLATGTKSEDLISTINMLGDISGGNSTTFGRVATAYWQIMTDNILYAQDANQLTEAGVPIWQWVADYFNEIGRNPFDDTKSHEKYKGWWDVYKVRNLASAAKTPNEQLYGSKDLTDAVTSEEVNEIFRRQVSEGGERYNSMGNYMESGPGQLERMQDESAQLSAAILRPIYDLMTSGGFETITNGLIKLAEIIESVYGMIESIISYIGDKLDIASKTEEEFTREPGLWEKWQLTVAGLYGEDYKLDVAKGMGLIDGDSKTSLIEHENASQLLWNALFGIPTSNAENEQGGATLLQTLFGIKDAEADTEVTDNEPWHNETYGPPLPDNWVPAGSTFGDPSADKENIAALTEAVWANTEKTDYAALEAAVTAAATAGVKEGMSGITITGTVTTGNVVLNTGALVGSITPRIDLKLGGIAGRSARG